MSFTQALIEADTYLSRSSEAEKIQWLNERIANCDQYGEAGSLIKALLSNWRDYLVFVSNPEVNQDEVTNKWPWAIGWSGEGLPPYILQGLLINGGI